MRFRPRRSFRENANPKFGCKSVKQQGADAPRSPLHQTREVIVKNRLVLSLIATAILIPTVRAAEPDAAKLTEIRTKMQAFVAAGELAGAVTVAGRKDGVIHHEAVGLLNLESKQPMPKDALFRIASMTKPVTAIGIMILVDEGKLRVEDPVEKYLPEFRGQLLVAERTKDAVKLKKPSRPIALRDLLTHTSGLPGDFPPSMADLYAKRNHTLAEMVSAVSQRPLNFEPGSKWSYCNAGIDVLGRVIEVASGMSYEQFLQKRIFDPLGMTDTTFYPTQNALGRVAATYDRKDGEFVVAPNSLLGPPANAKYPIPAGGLYSTGADLAKLYRMMLNRGSLGKTQILSEKSVAEMTKIQTGDLKCAFTPGISFGLGWAVVNEPTGITAMMSPGSFGHGGAFGTQAWLDPKQDLFVILLIQRIGLPNSDASKFRQALQESAFAAIR
jgi:CubicO group peptidase (beta-lactamase class C family)